MARFFRWLCVLVVLGIVVAACAADEDRDNSLAAGTTSVPNEPTEVAPAPTDEGLSLIHI